MEDVIKIWLTNERASGNYSHNFGDYDDVCLDGNFDINGLCAAVVANRDAEIVKLVEGMKMPVMVFKRSLTEGGGYPDPTAKIYNRALDDIIKALAAIEV